MSRKVLCPECNAKNDFPAPVATYRGETEQGAMRFGIQNPDDEEIICFFCKKPLQLHPHDFQNVKFVESNDGYHSWFSQPTAIHTIWRCQSRPALCSACSHNVENDCFCINGRIDIRKPL